MTDDREPLDVRAAEVDMAALRQRGDELRARFAAYTRSRGTGALTATVRDHVLELLQDMGPSTDVGLVAAYCDLVDDGQAPEASPGLVRTARLQLVRAGKVEATGMRIPTPYGRTATMWRAVTRRAIDS